MAIGTGKTRDPKVIMSLQGHTCTVKGQWAGPRECRVQGIDIGERIFNDGMHGTVDLEGRSRVIDRQA